MNHLSCKTAILLLVFLQSLLMQPNAIADEIRPGYLALKETHKNRFDVVFKTPAKNGRKLAFNVKIPDSCKPTSKVITQQINSAYLQSWTVQCTEGLAKQTISIDGLTSSSTDVLLRLEFLNGESQSRILTSSAATYRVKNKASNQQIVSTYTLLGIEHILQGFDHLLFVFALLLLVTNLRTLLWTVTAFTLAHSITLALATLGFVHVPPKPVEAVIALSILFLAVELANEKLKITGLNNNTKGAAGKWPWLVAFIFGLLHGFGFAGALAQIGIPEHAIPLALVFFNVGVEIGQLMFIAVVLTLAWLAMKSKLEKFLPQAEAASIYVIGSLSSYWLFDRISSF